MHSDGVRRPARGKLPISCYRRYQHWSWTLAVVLACLAAVGCNSGSGGVGTPGNVALPSPASSGSVAVATSPESGGGNGGGGNGGGGNGGGGNGSGGNGSGGNGGGGKAVGAPMNIPAILANEEGAHSIERGEEDVTGVLENQYNCGPDLCNVTITTAPGTDKSNCISNISVQGRGGYDQTNGITVYRGDTITFTGTGGPCASSS
jgi:hypothetical protein